ncbi:uncharacterized protein C8R40DRAFT_1066675 [Lentinula edodes]|uniref:uncharacterized protein n=1 Tax=Lentinula edodes TaxID=5353 RepID=UPI001E8D62CF|nr:uncharacterized protein C8R40DRAFT_1066675 [Lentinula edodes]KAH7878921.1 hypothetical protein C8R40DRAFT_1066675 [Lentinula edodes]
MLTTSLQEFYIFDTALICLTLQSVVAVLNTTSVILDILIKNKTGFLQRLLDGFTLPLSGAFTARFILHLRAWQDKHAGVYIISTVEPRQQVRVLHDGIPLSSSDAMNVDIEAIFRPTPSMDEFGEDPVNRVLRLSSRSESGTIVVEVDCQVHAGEDDHVPLPPDVTG